MDTVNQNNDIDIAGLIKHYLKHWYLFVISIIACGVLAYGYTKIFKPVYLIKANLLIKQNDGDSPGSMQSAILKNFAFGG
ncbi:MAG: hypothetical protein J1E02_06585, partial [Coprobacter sp.]|nr:hypothetical protein [Coprobacter sp.]